MPLKLADFPVVKSISGLGMSDSDSYADILSDRFYYRNTHLHRSPMFDISALDSQAPGTLDFLLASEVFEHVNPPVEQAFRNALSLLQPDGVLALTVPYKPEGETEEHYPDLFDHALVRLRGGPILLNRTSAGELQVFDNLAFHGGAGSTLEMRCFSETGLRTLLSDAGFHYGTDSRRGLS